LDAAIYAYVEGQMQIITITISNDPGGQPSLRLLYSDGIDPRQGADACRKAAGSFDELAIEAEVQRRITEQLEQKESDK